MKSKTNPYGSGTTDVDPGYKAHGLGSFFGLSQVSRFLIVCSISLLIFATRIAPSKWWDPISSFIASTQACPFSSRSLINPLSWVILHESGLVTPVLKYALKSSTILGISSTGVAGGGVALDIWNKFLFLFGQSINFSPSKIPH